MFWSAAELTAMTQAQAVAVDAVIQRVRPSLAILGSVAHPTGAAALIDAEQGLFLAHSDAVEGDTVQARVNDVRVRLKVLGRDQRTDLVVLACPVGVRPTGRALEVADAIPAPGSKIIVLMADGGALGSFVGGQQFSIVGSSKQAVPVSELRFESMPRLVSGALVLSTDGQLIGAMRATLAERDRTVRDLQTAKAIVEQQRVQGFGSGGAGVAKSFANPLSQYGPAALTVAYSPNLNLMRRAVEGFRSADHKPTYTAFGVQVADNPNGGALVRRVFDTSPAGKIGVHVGDILIQMGSARIDNQADFVNALLLYKPGDHITVKLLRNGNEITFDVTMARSKA